jgi:hypothetical protein
MMNNIIEATILNGKFKGEDVLLPRIPMIPTDMPFEFKRLQFPMRLACNDQLPSTKHKGSLQVCGLNLENPCFSHGQLYVACSRVEKPSNLFVHSKNWSAEALFLCRNECRNDTPVFSVCTQYTPEGKTKNIVDSKALQ